MAMLKPVLNGYRRLPRPVRHQIKRPSSRRKVVTMAAGFLCSDGVVIAADRQITGSQYTYQECKLNTLKWANGTAIWGYSGSPDTAKRLDAELKDCFTPNVSVQHPIVATGLELSLTKSLKKKEAFATLFGAWLDGEESPSLLISNGVNAVPVSRCEVIGWGDSPLARYLRGLFLKGSSMTNVSQAIVIAIYFLLQGKNYDGQWVGGGTDVFIIDSQHRHRKIDVGRTRIWESALEAIERENVALWQSLTGTDSFAHNMAPFSQFIGKAEFFSAQVRALKAVEDVV